MRSTSRSALHVQHVPLCAPRLTSERLAELRPRLRGETSHLDLFETKGTATFAALQRDLALTAGEARAGRGGEECGQFTLFYRSVCLRGCRRLYPQGRVLRGGETKAMVGV